MINIKIKKILVPLDGSKNSERGLDFSIALARECNAMILGLYVIFSPARSEFGKSGNFEKGAFEKVKRFLEKAKTKAAQNGIVFVDKIAYGDVGYHIVEFAQNKKNNVDLIVMGSRGRGRAKEMIFGSTTYHVMHATRVPVLVVK